MPAAGQGPTSIAVADFNRDGILDMAVSSLADNVVTILLGNGDGTFTSGTPATTAMGSISEGLTAGDFNGDGKIDLAVSNANGAGTENSNVINILLGNGDGTFTLSSQSPATGRNPYGATVADFNGDGNLDLAVPNELDGTVTLLLGNGDGTFNTVPETPATGNYPVQIAVGDFNGDGIPDLAAVNIFGNNIVVFVGKGDGTFTTDPLSPTTGQEPCGVAVADFNGDGLSDMAAALQYLASPPQADPINIFLSQLTVTETAQVTHIAPPGDGTHQVNAGYPGDSNYGPSISRVVPLQGVLIPTALT
jgi:FG-GAP-like repeat